MNHSCDLLFLGTLYDTFTDNRTDSDRESRTSRAASRREKCRRKAKMKSSASKSASSTKKHHKRKDAGVAKGSYPVVAIGASAGGLEAFKEFFLALQADSGMAFVLIQHLDPNHESMLTEIIAKATTMAVEEVRSGTLIRPNHVFVIPPNALMAMADGVFQLTPRGRAPAQPLAVNFFMHSLAKERKSGAIAIVLSGT